MLDIMEQIQMRIEDAERAMKEAEAVYMRALGGKMELKRLQRWIQNEEAEEIIKEAHRAIDSDSKEEPQEDDD
jgi:hypothetical protein